MSEAFAQALARCTPANRRQKAFLKSWREHPNRADLWRAFENAATSKGKALPAPEDFISAVLGAATMPASVLNDHSKHILGQFKKLKRQITAVVNDAIYPLDLWRDLARFEAALRELDRSDYDMHAPAAGGRKDVKRSRDRKLFAIRMLRYFEITCGEPPSSEGVAMLLDVAFPRTSTDGRIVRQWFDEVKKPAV